MPDGDHFVVNGQKVWTSGAHDADVLLTFVRTDPDAPKHQGISVLLIPTDTAGVVRQPFASACGREDVDFNEVFFSDVRVPAENLVGQMTRAGRWPTARWVTNGRCSGSDTPTDFGNWSPTFGRRARCSATTTSRW